MFDENTQQLISQAPGTAPAVPAAGQPQPYAPFPAPSPDLAASQPQPAPAPTFPPAAPSPTPDASPAAVTAPALDPLAPAATDNDLVGLKQDALTHLQPLVDQLDQPPEEQFKTTMMMIQATDDQRLLKKALETAKKITDDKIRAQALLDIINEINYFSSQK